MRRYLVVRLTSLLFAVFCILNIMFALFKLIPGDPTAIFVDNNFSQEVVMQQRKLWGLDDPLLVQYLRYLRNMATFDFGSSFFQIRPVRTIIVEKLLNTCAMMIPALALSVLLGTCLGAVAGWKRGSLFESTTIMASLFLRSVPSFFIGILVLMVFSYNLRWLPSGGMNTPGMAHGF